MRKLSRLVCAMKRMLKWDPSAHLSNFQRLYDAAWAMADSDKLGPGSSQHFYLFAQILEEVADKLSSSSDGYILIERDINTLTGMMDTIKYYIQVPVNIPEGYTSDDLQQMWDLLNSLVFTSELIEE